VIDRRTLLVGAAALAACASAPEADAFAALEARAGGRLGVCAWSGGARIGWRMDERFGFCSTIKLPLAALTLREIDQGRLAGDEVLAYARGDLLFNSPAAERHLATGMTMKIAAEAAQVESDNLAANLLIARLGGPAAVTARFRALGDPVTRLDRTEPTLNFVPAGEMRDTSSPRAMCDLVARFLEGDALKPESRDELMRWMTNTQTGLKRLRAGVPADWRVGDKTGTGLADGMPNKTNDIAFFIPPGRAPVFVTCFLETPASENVRDADLAIHAEVGRVVAAWAASR
jgi:beta-lactamase class A